MCDYIVLREINSDLRILNDAEQEKKQQQPYRLDMIVNEKNRQQLFDDATVYYVKPVPYRLTLIVMTKLQRHLSANFLVDGNKIIGNLHNILNCVHDFFISNMYITIK